MCRRKWAAVAALIGTLMWAGLVTAQEQPGELPPLAGGEIVEVQPGAADLTRAQAEAAARRAVAECYGESEESLTDCRAESMLYAFPEQRELTIWSVLLYPLAEPPGGTPVYGVELDGRTGETSLCLDWREDNHPTATLAVDRRRRGMELIWGSSWTQEQRAAFDTWATEIGYFPDGIGACVLPAAGDLPQVEALRLAESALVERYGWEAGRFQRYEASALLIKIGEASRAWCIQLSPAAGSPEEPEGGCRVHIASPSGKVLEISADWDGNG